MIVPNLKQFKSFDHHKFVIPLYNDTGKILGFIAIHRGNDAAPAFGATRIWHYSSLKEALNDVLQLSRLMSYKSALAGLPYGGAKAVLLNGFLSKHERKSLIKAYAQKVNFLRGGFITGADLGVEGIDLKLMKNTSKYIVGVSTDPVKYTVLGVYSGIQACLYEVFGSESLHNRSFAIQGVGKTGKALLELLYKDAKKIIICDVNEKRILQVIKKYPRVEVVPPAEIFKQEVDVYCPCALGNVITHKNIKDLRAKIICGSANNQLENDKIGELLFKRNILYAPDYVVNAGGLIAVVEEYEKPQISEERISKKVSDIKRKLKHIIEVSKKSKVPTNIIANEMAEKIFNKFN